MPAPDASFIITAETRWLLQDVPVFEGVTLLRAYGTVAQCTSAAATPCRDVVGFIAPMVDGTCPRHPPIRAPGTSVIGVQPPRPCRRTARTPSVRRKGMPGGEIVGLDPVARNPPLKWRVAVIMAPVSREPFAGIVCMVPRSRPKAVRSPSTVDHRIFGSAVFIT